MARARLVNTVLAEESATDVDLRKSANTIVTVYETNGVTLFAGTIYSAASGGSALINGTDTKTNTVGLLDLYVEPSNARRVKLAVTGVATQIDAEFTPDPSTLTDLVQATTASTISGAKTMPALAVPGVISVRSGVSQRRYWDPHDYAPGGALSPVGLSGSYPDFYYTGTANDAAFEEAIANAQASSTCKYVLIPEGQWGIEHIDATLLDGITFFGMGALRSILVPLPGSHGNHVFDILGGNHLILRDFGIGQPGFNNAQIPTSILHYGISGASGNAIRLENLILYGRTSGGTFYNEAGVSSYAIGCFFHTYGTGATGAAVRMVSATDWSFVHCEIHELEAYWNEPYTGSAGPGGLPTKEAPWTGTSSTVNTIIQNCADINFYGSNGGGNASVGIQFDGADNYRIAFYGREIYPQDPVGVAYNVVFRNNGTVTGLVVDNCLIAAGSSIFGGASGCVYKNVQYRSRMETISPAGALIATDANATIEDSEFECRGLSVNVGAGGTITRSKFWNVSSITAGTKTGVISTDTSGNLTNTATEALGTTPATTGAVRLTKATGIYALNNAGNANIQMINTNTSNHVLIGDGTNAVKAIIDASTDDTLRIGGVNKVYVDGTGVSFNTVAQGGTAPAPANFTVSNPTADRLTLDQTSATAAEVREVLGTVVSKLIANGLFT